MKLASLFDGIGGALLCAQKLGIEAVWSSEIEPFPIKVTKYHFPNVKHLGDITKINGAAVEPVDIIVGGSPCQDLSVAGLRQGMKHADFGDEEGTRSGLFMEQIRIIKEMRNATGSDFPRFMVWENVPGAFSSKGSGDQLKAGDAFRIVLEETARVADPSISIPRSPSGWANSGSILGDGFSISWRTVDAQYWGVPQRRRRIYLVADFGGQSAPEILFEREGLRGHFAESGTEGQDVAADVSNGVIEASRNQQERSNPDAGRSEKRVDSLDEVQRATAFSLDSLASNSMKSDNPHSGCHVTETSKCIDTTNPDPSKNQGGVAIVQPVICLQGNGIDRADTAGCNGKGWTEDVCYTLNTIDRPAVATFRKSARAQDKDGVETWVEDEKANTINTFDVGDVRTTEAVVFENHPQDSRVTGPLDVANSVVKQYGTGGGNVPFVMETYQQISGCLSPGAHPGSYNGQDAYNDMLVASVDCRNMTETGEIHGTLQAKENGGQSLNYMGAVRQATTVRRLTPLECERLQGYPDNYTNIPGASDSARYKALGNSFAIPNAEFVLHKISILLN